LVKQKIVSSFRKNIIIGVFVLVFLISNIYLSLQTVSSGAKLSKLEKTESEIVKGNRELSSKLVKATSLISVQEKSVELGFVKPLALVFVKGVEPVASKLQ